MNYKIKVKKTKIKDRIRWSFLLKNKVNILFKILVH